MPFFTIPIQFIQSKTPIQKITDEELSIKIEEKVQRFKEFMVSGDYHELGGCDVPVITDSDDCP